MATELQHNALKAIAKSCNNEMKTIDRNDMKSLAETTNRFADKAKAIGFSRFDMMHMIGCINGVLKDRRLDY
jgi:hypothetical protein